jgi:hypothetical protein
MVAIMWLTGGKKPPTPAKAAPSAATVQAPFEVNETKIAEMQNRIQDLQRQQLVAQAALAQQARQMGAATHDSQSQQPGAGGTGEQRPEEDPIQAERKRRAYVSLFASNVALSYRKAPASAPSPATEHALAAPASIPSGPDTAQIAQLLKEMQPIPISPVPGTPSSPPTQTASAETTKDRKEETKRPAVASAEAANAAAGKTFVLFEGTILETVLSMANC